ncbi:hypothetical protein O181_059229 [Austropuccinia psidii MF-1]|uniref:Uncharacterized protein n=1 Tax=Austropuccinia psidii MF-1 TaxID=1389203 RepID=A0A9Q3EE01_9BASI|nr:hypothetical protein [Austropuccinia psidii MF-1]
MYRLHCTIVFQANLKLANFQKRPSLVRDTRVALLYHRQVNVAPDEPQRDACARSHRAYCRSLAYAATPSAHLQRAGVVSPKTSPYRLQFGKRRVLGVSTLMKELGNCGIRTHAARARGS